MPLVKPPLPSRPSSSVDRQEKHTPTFAPCPYSNFATGETNWFHITTPKPFLDVDICSNCYNTSFRNTPYAKCISKAPPKPANTATRCDLSDRWNRVAYLWLCSERAPDLTLFGSTAVMSRDKEGVCPNLNLEDASAEVQKQGKPTATRTWYCLSDPTTGSLVEDLTVCSDCVARLYHIFPCLNRIFQPVANGQKLQATCDLLTARDLGNRGEEYINQIINTASETLETRTRDTRSLVKYFKKWAPIPTCVKAQQASQGTPAYTFPKSIPEFAACQECYTKHALPLLESDTPPIVLREMKQTVFPAGFVCDLYSPRLLQYFNDACASYNLDTYRQRLLTRETKMQEYNLKLKQMNLQHQQFERQVRMHNMQVQTEQNNATLRSMQWNASPYYAPPVDFSRVNAAINQSSQALMQAEMVEENMRMLRKEWADLWE
ncbi:hypothetical protein M3J09_011866 [Ascochyta lentis]